eukprot:TRINITY_DN17934_c0_g1_i1.p1 TRINITY_DN17934_c0_g1~~TRINITY_DN17934_c0_g1_i1.p1  ORF type:complete len:732 (+),score=140.93 TRINITY_DN17934_c0_g1_i1:108-2303(+)
MVASRTRSAGDGAAAAVTTHSVSSSRSRPGLVQAVIALVMLTMGVALMYMYRTIDKLHQEQQAMRMQIAQLNEPTSAQLSGGAAGTAFAMLDGKQGHAQTAAEQEFLEKREGEKTHVSVQLPPEPHRQKRIERPSLQHGHSDDEEPDPRRLSAMYTTGMAANKGCYEISDTAFYTLDVSTTSCTDSSGNNFNCPDCFISPSGGLSQNVMLTIQSCSSAAWVRNSNRAGVWVYTFINMDATRTITVRDSTGAGTTEHQLPPLSYVQAWCSSSLGTSDKLTFPSRTIPNLIVDNGLTLSSGDFDASASSGVFKTSTGTNTLNGNTVIAGSGTLTTGAGNIYLNGNVLVADAKTFVVGSADGAGGATTFKGSVTIGQNVNAMSKTLTVYGSIAQNDDADGTLNTLSTATGAISLNGATTVAAGKDLTMDNSGAGAFTTGTGAVALNGDTTIASTKTFDTGQAQVNLNGNVQVAEAKTLTVGTGQTNAVSASNTILYGTLQVGGTADQQSTSVTINGDFTQNDDNLATEAKNTFTTATGTHTLNGDVDIAQNKYLHMDNTGTGTFVTATGTVTLNGDVSIASTKTFSTGTGGLVTLNGMTTVSHPYNFQVGQADTGATSVTTLYGNVFVGGSGKEQAKLLKVYGDFEQVDDIDPVVAKKTFTTATGQVSLNGNVIIRMGQHLEQSGAGHFTTGTAAVTLNGDTTVATGKTFTLEGLGVACTSNTLVGTPTYCTAR